MSLKTDDEAASTRLFPSIPAFRDASPFVRPTAEVERPAEVSPKRWSEVLPELLAWSRRQLQGVPVPPGAEGVDAHALREEGAVDLAGRLVARLDKAVWARPDSQVLTACSNLLARPDLIAVLDDRLARLELRGLQLRSLQGHVFRICDGGEIAQRWKVESGPAELLSAGPSASFIRYHFASADDAPVVLRFDFDSPVGPEDLHRLIVPLRGDDSWHRIDATLELGGRHWVSKLSYYVAQFRPASILLQPPCFQDESPQPKTWVPMEEIIGSPQSTGGEANHLALAGVGGTNVATPAPSAATLRLIIRPSSTLRAICGKVERNYVRAFRAVPFFRYVGNSVLLVALSMAGSLFSASFVGYAFARLNWPGRGLALGVLLSTMMLPAQVTMIPSFLIWKSLGWYNTLNPLWVGAWFGNAFFIFLMVQNMKTIPRELDEAARIDGLNAVQAWWYVILPQVKPTLAAISIMTFMGAWNEFMGPLIMLRDQDKFPLSLGLFGMRVDQSADWTMIMAGNMLMVLPVVAIFFLFQRYFIEGVTVSGMKG